jgi:hypothetical protein
MKASAKPHLVFDKRLGVVSKRGTTPRGAGDPLVIPFELSQALGA